MMKPQAPESPYSKMVQRLVSSAERVRERAEAASAKLVRQAERDWRHGELERLEDYIRAMAPDPGYVLTAWGERQIENARQRQRWIRQLIEDETRPLRQEARELHALAGRVHHTLKKLPHLQEGQQIETLLTLLDPESPLLLALDHKAIEAARLYLQSLAEKADADALRSARENTEPSEEELNRYIPAPADMEIDPADTEVIQQAAQRRFDPVEDYELNLAAQHLSLMGGFESLMCLPLLHGVEHYPFQINTARQVMRTMRGRALLCDEVGLGKTIEAGLILKEYLVRGLARKVLALVPPALVSQWREEMQDKFGIHFTTHDDPEFRAKGPEAWESFDRVVASLHTAKSAQHSSAIEAISYDMIIVDEAHHLKNRATVNWKFVNGLKSKYILLLTATPVQNNLDELFNLITLLSPGQLKTSSAFRREFVARGDPRQPKNSTKLRELLMDVMIRNTRSQVSVALPPRRATTLRMPLSPAERALYDAATHFVREEYRGHSSERFLAQTLQAEVGSSPQALLKTLETMRGRRRTGAEKLDRLHDLATTVKTSAKADTLTGLLHQQPHKVLIFTRYRETQHFLLQTLEGAGISAASFSGEMSASEKDRQVAAFAADRQALVSTDVGSEGRNLQFCHTLVNYDLPWNPMQIEQRVGRVHRIGQTEPVTIFNLAAHDTVEDYILEVLDSKINMFELVVGEVGEILGNLDEEREFEDLVLDLWLNAPSTDAARQAFSELGNQLVDAREKYREAREYDEALFGEEFVAEE